MTHALAKVDEPRSLMDLLWRRSAEQPDLPLYTVLADGEVAAGSITVSRLLTEACSLGSHLFAANLSGQCVLLMYPSGIEFITALFGCISAGVIAVPVPVPANREQSIDHIVSIARDCRAQAILSLTSVRQRLGSWWREDGPTALPWLLTDQDALSSAPDWAGFRPGHETIAYLQYTSGSTSRPKGVVVSHGNVLHNSAYIASVQRNNAESIGVCWLPHFHDMGLIEGIMQPFYSGYRTYLMPPAAFVRNPFLWVRAISRHGATNSGGPDFAYRLCAERVAPEQRSELALGCWRFAYCGAEPIHADTVAAFARFYSPCGFSMRAFYPSYGLAEATLLVSTRTRGEGESVVCHVDAEAMETDNTAVFHRPEECNSAGRCRKLVASGQIGEHVQVRIVSPETQTPCAPGQIGEIWVAGGSVAQGYWQAPEATLRAFGARMAGAPDVPYLRTGDLGFLRGQDLFITGRLKDMIIFCGRNLYPEDIEAVVERCHTALHPGGTVAVAVDVGDDRLVIVSEVNRRFRKADLDPVIRAIHETVSEVFGVPVHAILLVPIGKVPRTTSGKVRRQACQDGYRTGTLAPISSFVRDEDPLHADVWDGDTEGPPEDRRQRIEAFLLSALRRAGGMLSGMPDTLVSAGMDSLASMRLSYHIERRFGVRLPPSLLLQRMRVSDLVDCIANHSSEAQTGPPCEGECPGQQSTYPASIGQQSLWIEHHRARPAPAYNLMYVLRIRSVVDPGCLSRALRLLVEHHPILRSTFSVDGSGHLMVTVHPDASVDLEVRDGSGWSDVQVDAYLSMRGHAEFDLERGPLIRAALVVRSGSDYLFLMAAHHIVLDHLSCVIVTRELLTTYDMLAQRQEPATDDLGEQDPHFGFVKWQQSMISSGHFDREWAYWRDEIPGALASIAMPTDRPRPRVQTYEGRALSFAIPEDLFRDVYSLAQNQATTPYAVLLTAYLVLLHRYSGQDDLMIGTFASGRSCEWMESIVGFLANPVVIRADFARNPSLADCLAQVAAAVLRALDHQDYPFALLVQRLAVHRDPAHSPVFQSVFHMQPEVFAHSGYAPTVSSGLVCEPYSIEQRIARYDLEMAVVVAAGCARATLQYNSHLFKESTCARMMEHYLVILRMLVSTPLCPIGSFALPDDRVSLSSQPELGTGGSIPDPLCLHSLVERQAALTPDAIALVDRDKQISYRELACRVGAMAGSLRARGVGREQLVGVGMHRSAEMVISLLAILSTGAAYVPIDPDLPPERRQWILKDSGARLLLEDNSLASSQGPRPAEGICADAQCLQIPLPDAPSPSSRRRTDVVPGDLAYVLYTSGSTGLPKGVAIPHSAASSFLAAVQQEIGVLPSDCLYAVTSISFDISVLELFLPLACGARVVIGSGLLQDVCQTAGQLAAHGASIMQATPAVWRLVVDSGWTAPRAFRALCGGEALPWSLATDLLECGADLWNLYGPTEATVWSSLLRVSRDHGPCYPTSTCVPIGFPLRNTQLRVLDRYRERTPRGIVGELFIGGQGLARCYHRRPGLTAERFTPLPGTGSAGRRMYQTGDLVWQAEDENLVFLGRSDSQVKINGHRIELGEIEHALTSDSAVREAAAVFTKGPSCDQGEQRGELRALVVFEEQVEGATEADVEARQQEWTRVWNCVFQKAVAEGASDAPEFAGWTSRLTMEPFSAVDMREWATRTASRILAFRPERVLEVGCGDGALLLRIAPYCRRYVGSDPSPEALACIRRRMEQSGVSLEHVHLLDAPADAVGTTVEERFDTIVINSVAQYFPDSAYLVRVLQQLVRLVTPGGRIFLGDVRDYRTLEPLCMARELLRGPGAANVRDCWWQARRTAQSEPELCVDPRFFPALHALLPQLTGVAVLAKCGTVPDELLLYRYDVLLAVGQTHQVPDGLVCRDWQPENLSVPAVRRYLTEDGPRWLLLRRVPETRMTSMNLLLAQLRAGEEVARTMAQHYLTAHQREGTLDLSAMWEIAKGLPYDTAVYPALDEQPGLYDILLSSRDSSGLAHGADTWFVSPASNDEWRELASNPVQHVKRARLINDLQRRLQTVLPSYCIPAIVDVSSLPRNANGKIDYKQAALYGDWRATSDGLSRQLDTPTEKALGELWAKLLGKQILGDEDFFQLGGHSLLAVQLVSLIHQELGWLVPVAQVFQTPTIAGLAAYIDSTPARPEGATESGDSVFDGFEEGVV